MSCCCRASFCCCRLPLGGCCCRAWDWGLRPPWAWEASSESSSEVLLSGLGGWLVELLGIGAGSVLTAAGRSSWERLAAADSWVRASGVGILLPWLLWESRRAERKE